MNTKPKHSDWVDPDDAPEWTEADFSAADYRIGDTVVARPTALAEVAKRKRGPGKRAPKVPTTLRIPPNVLARWKATGPGWQTRMVERLAAP